MKIEKGLNPNCSEIVFRFVSLTREVDTADGSSVDNFLEEAAEMLKRWDKRDLVKALKKPFEYGLTAKFYENIGGGGSWEWVRQACWLATQVVLEKISLDEAKKMLHDEKKTKMIAEEF
jgi:hypothetical protein